MKTGTKLSMVAAALALAGCGPDLGEGAGDELGSLVQAAKSPRAPAVSYALKTTAARNANPVWSTSFPIAATIFVYLATVVTGTLAGHHTAQVLVSMPGGSAYQVFDVAFATTVIAGANEQQAEAISGGYRVWVAMPVAGTMIQQYSLSGPWFAQVYVDGAGSPNATAAFNLN